ncbi:MAG: hypothetical protein JJ902_22470 [Roseibium sp.]|nr:hypothetical protein [Roseibium sp.]
MAQDELKVLFHEIDMRSDRALEGVRAVRRARKLEALPGEPRTRAMGSAFVFTVIAVMALLLD